MDCSTTHLDGESFKHENGLRFVELIMAVDCYVPRYNQVLGSTEQTLATNDAFSELLKVLQHELLTPHATIDAMVLLALQPSPKPSCCCCCYCRENQALHCLTSGHTHIAQLISWCNKVEGGDKAAAAGASARTQSACQVTSDSSGKAQCRAAVA